MIFEVQETSAMWWKVWGGARVYGARISSDFGGPCPWAVSWGFLFAQKKARVNWSWVFPFPQII
jgi:hypothetical protein